MTTTLSNASDVLRRASHLMTTTLSNASDVLRRTSHLMTTTLSNASDVFRRTIEDRQVPSQKANNATNVAKIDISPKCAGQRQNRIIKIKSQTYVLYKIKQ
jgi:hypothetical protein